VSQYASFSGNGGGGEKSSKKSALKSFILFAVGDREEMNKRRATSCQTEQAMLSTGKQEKLFRFWHSPFIKGSRNSTIYMYGYDWYRPPV